MKATKLPSGNYRVRVYVGEENGKKKFISVTDRTAKDAMRKALMLQKDVSSDTFKSALQAYIRLKEPVLSPASIRGYKNIERVMNREYTLFCNKAVNKISADDVQSVINDMVKQGYTPKTIKNYNGIISAALKSKGVRITPTLPRKDDKEIQIPTEEEIKKIIAETKDTILEIPVLLASYRGLRRGEVWSLTLSDFDFKNGVLHVQRDIVLGADRKWHVKPPKTSAGNRYIPIPPEVMERVKERGIPDLDPASLGKRFYRLMKKLNMDYHFHSLRHFATSYLHSIGIPDAYLMSWMGWENDHVLKMIYRHSMRDMEKDFARLADEKMRGWGISPP